VEKAFSHIPGAGGHDPAPRGIGSIPTVPEVIVSALLIIGVVMTIISSITEVIAYRVLGCPWCSLPFPLWLLHRGLLLHRLTCLQIGPIIDLLVAVELKVCHLPYKRKLYRAGTVVQDSAPAACE
jgi:hypothetical protein